MNVMDYLKVKRLRSFIIYLKRKKIIVLIKYFQVSDYILLELFEVLLPSGRKLITIF